MWLNASQKNTSEGSVTLHTSQSAITKAKASASASSVLKQLRQAKTTAKIFTQ